MHMYLSKSGVCYVSGFEDVRVFPIAFGTNKKALNVVRLHSADVMGVSSSRKLYRTLSRPDSSKGVDKASAPLSTHP